jgi:D-arabinose 1-dehydrogenase-like Zn-dependent alcohol dehydrogenase
VQIEGYRIHQWGGELHWESFEVPEPAPGECLVRVEACSIGLTVLNCIRGDLANDPALLPRVPGHELIGRVEKTGPGVTSLQPGQRVMAYFYLVSGTSYACLSGRDSLSEDLAGWVGIHRDGGYASHSVLPAQNLLPLPESIPGPQATAIPDAVATPLHVCKTRAKVQPGDRVVVIGAGGGVGIHMIQMARLFGAAVAGLEIDESKFELIAELGAAPISSPSFDQVDLTTIWNDRSPSVVIDLVGNPASLKWSLEALDTGGRMVILTTFRDVKMAVDPRELVFREISLLGSRYAARAELIEAANLVAAGQIRPIVSQVVPPEQVNEVHQALRAGTLLGRGALDWTRQDVTV